MNTTTPNAMPAWIVRAWPPVFWQAGREQPAHFVHLGTQVLSPGDEEHPLMGQTLWGTHNPRGDAGLAWDWVELTDGVVAMADPLAVITNLRIVGPAGEELNSFEALLRINQLVHTLPWQDEVQRALRVAA